MINLENKLATPPLFKGIANLAKVGKHPFSLTIILATAKPLNAWMLLLWLPLLFLGTEVRHKR